MSDACSQLDSALLVYQNLHDLKGGKLRELDPRSGWIKTAVQLYFSMRSTAPLLRFVHMNAMEHCPQFLDFLTWASSHSVEEQDHAEWFLDDLACIGLERSRVLSMLPDEYLLRLIGMQFSLVSCTHPISALGYFYAMECHPRDEASVRALPDSLRLPADAFRTIIYHANADQEHQIEIRRLINKYATSEYLFHIVHRAATESLMGWTQLFSKYIDEFQSQSSDERYGAQHEQKITAVSVAKSAVH